MGLMFCWVLLQVFSNEEGALQREYVYQHWQLGDQNLNSNRIMAVGQDALGFIWVGTLSGLQRYDGLGFTTVQPELERPDRLSSGQITGIFADSRGFLWVGTFDKGLNRLDPGTMEVVRFRNLPNRASRLSNDRIASIAEDKDGNIWVGTLSGLNRIDPESLQVTRYLYDPTAAEGSIDNLISKIYVDLSGSLWVGTRNGPARFDPESETFRDMAFEGPEPKDPRKVMVSAMGQLHQKNLWVATYHHGLGRFNSDSGEQIPLLFDEPFQEKSLHTMLADRKGRLWLGFFGNGLGLYEPGRGTLRGILNTPDDPNHLANKSVRVLFEDDIGTVWIGTEQSGLYRFDARTLAFNHFSLAEKDRTNQRRIVGALAAGADGNIWVGNEVGQVWRIDREKEWKERIELGPESERARISCLLEDDHHNLWIGIWRQGLLRIDLATRERTWFKAGPDRGVDLPSNAVNAIMEDRQGQLWIGTVKGLCSLDPKSGVFRRFDVASMGVNRLQNEVVYALCEDIEGQLWVGTSLGEVHRMHQDGSGFTVIEVTTEKGLDTFDYRVTSLECGPNGEIYVGTHGEGLKRIDPKTNRVSAVPGGPEMMTAVVAEDDRFLWVSGYQNGLSRFDLHLGQVETFGLDKGVVNSQFSAGAVAVTPAGDLVFGGNKGLLAFHPEAVDFRRPPPEVLFSRFLASGEPVFSNPSQLPPSLATFHPRDNISLAYNQNTLTLKFFGLRAAQPEKVRYQHKLEPLDSVWKDHAPGQREMTFYNLGPGRYQVLLRAAPRDGVGETASKTLSFVIRPPIWQTPRAYALYLLMLVAAVWWWIRKRTRALRHQAVQLESQVQLRTREIQNQKDTIEGLLERQKALFANVSHEFRTPLALILGPVDRLLRRENTDIAKPLSSVRHNALVLLRMVDQILDLARLDRPRIAEKKVTNASGTVDVLVNAFDAVFKTRDLHLEFAITPDCWIPMNRDSLEKVMLNLLSNAVKYTSSGGTIGVSVTREKSRVLIRVEDSGLGIPRKDVAHIFNRFYRCEAHQGLGIPGAGIGLAMVKALTESSGGTIDVASEEGHGTTFTLSLPLCEPGEEGPAKAGNDSDDAVTLELNSLKENAVSQPWAEPPGDPDGATVLVVEDNPAMLAYIQNELGDIYHCIGAQNGEQALALAQNTVPDLVVSDVMMPGMDGFQLNRALKNHPGTSHIPVILLTAKGDRESLMNGIKGGAEAYLTKPFDSQELKYRIENLLAVREILKQRYASELFLPLASRVVEDDENPLDTEFLTRFQAMLEDHYENPEFGLPDMIDFMAMSERPLQRKLKALTDHTPSQFLRKFRLKKAAELLREGHKSSDVAFEVGFSSHSYFSACFKAQFGLSPSAFAGKSP